MTRGQVDTALLYGGKDVLRRVVADKGDIVVICAEDEYQQAQREGRDPSGIGFPRADISDYKEVAILS